MVKEGGWVGGWVLRGFGVGMGVVDGELDLSKPFCKSIRNLQFNLRTINKEISIESANLDL